MEQFSGLIAILLEHSQRFFEIWNFQIIISMAVIGFVLSNEGLMVKNMVRLNITLVFLLIAIFSVFTLSVHHQREVQLWMALEARVAAAPSQFIPEEVQYLASLKPTSFLIKGGALVVADLLVILVTWVSPKVRLK
ncbi:MAG: hypothetical protein IPP66_18450 [Anaerolineales bacterium]|nr:hypothetical protein [Anaerolineales bacterium]